MGAFTNPTPARPFAATALPDKPSALSQRLIREGCEKARSYRTLAQLLDEHREMLAALKGTPCFGCGVRFGADNREARGCVTCGPSRAIIAKVEAP